ncbi:DUF3052 domain-containing protein [Nocardioidaceae bacterium]|nr:DUF3052 domain-containing protein [Nocardioidaceae bacterium]
MSATAGGDTTHTVGEKLGLKKGMLVQELGWDEDVDDGVRREVEDAIDADMIDGGDGSVVDVVLMWWRDGDGDLVDDLVDALTDLGEGGAVWLVTPKVGRPGAVDHADITEAAPVAGLSTTSTVVVSDGWSATCLVAPKQGR